jgi:hypothetical protein
VIRKVHLQVNPQGHSEEVLADLHICRSQSEEFSLLMVILVVNMTTVDRRSERRGFVFNAADRCVKRSQRRIRQSFAAGVRRRIWTRRKISKCEKAMCTGTKHQQGLNHTRERPFGVRSPMRKKKSRGGFKKQLPVTMLLKVRYRPRLNGSSTDCRARLSPSNNG